MVIINIIYHYHHRYYHQRQNPHRPRTTYYCSPIHEDESIHFVIQSYEYYKLNINGTDCLYPVGPFYLRHFLSLSFDDFMQIRGGYFSNRWYNGSIGDALYSNPRERWYFCTNKYINFTNDNSI